MMHHSEQLYYVDEDFSVSRNGMVIQNILELLNAKYAKRQSVKRIESGRNRNVFIFDKHVVKVPRNCYGMADNDWEGSVSGDELARTRVKFLVFDGCVIVPIVFMELVNPISSDYELPDWCMSIDCQQVGHTLNGKLVAYDFGVY